MIRSVRIRKCLLPTVLICITTIIVFYSGQQSSNSFVDFLRNALPPLDGIFSPPPDDDPWFQKRFIRSIKPFLTRENKKLSNDTRTWWREIQNDNSAAKFSEVVEKLFQVIPDNDNLYKDAGPERCRTCAVVGNSGNLKGSRYGPLIDSSDVIIRMNMAPTSGFEEDVGSRTTHHIMYPESALDLDNTTFLLLIPFKTLDLQWITSALTTGSIEETYVPVRSRIKANKNRVLIYSPAFFKYVYDTWLESHGRYPSTGFLSLFFALHICDKVSVYGFGADQYGNWHHYWENNYHGGEFRKTGVHDADYENNVTLLLADKHKIDIFKGF